MSAGWVAGSVRGRQLATRALGAAGARRLAAAGNVAGAAALLADSVYSHDVRAGPVGERDIGALRHAVGSACLWHLRILAGWLPARGVNAAGVFALRFELANIADRFAAVGGAAPRWSPYDLGTLSVAWRSIASGASAEQLRALLAASPWGDPGPLGPGDPWGFVEPALEARWALWLAAVPGASRWAQGWAGLVIARAVSRHVTLARPVTQCLGRVVGSRWEGASSVRQLAVFLPRPAAWVLEGVAGPEDLWRAEGRWWRGVDQDAGRILVRGGVGPDVATAAAGRLMADVWRVRAAIEMAGWGDRGLETFDAVA